MGKEPCGNVGAAGVPSAKKETLCSFTGLGERAPIVAMSGGEVNSRSAGPGHFLAEGDSLSIFSPAGGGRALGIAESLRGWARNGLVPWAAEREASASFGLGAREVEAACLAEGLLPARYARNAGTLGIEGQVALHRSRVVVAGCGGLGGYLVEMLARLGVGTIVAVDPDVFDESNLNRQLLATVESLGKPKADVAAERMALVNPAVVALAVRERLRSHNAAEILARADAVADALDTIDARLELARACKDAGLPFVHASIAGWYGQASTQGARSAEVEAIYGAAAAERGVETRLGNPAFAPALAAALEAAELCKLLTGRAPSLGGRVLAFDLLAMEFTSLSL